MHKQLKKSPSSQKKVTKATKSTTKKTTSTTKRKQHTAKQQRSMTERHQPVQSLIPPPVLVNHSTSSRLFPSSHFKFTPQPLLTQHRKFASSWTHLTTIHYPDGEEEEAELEGQTGVLPVNPSWIPPWSRKHRPEIEIPSIDYPYPGGSGVEIPHGGIEIDSGGNGGILGRAGGSNSGIQKEAEKNIPEPRTIPEIGIAIPVGLSAKENV